MGGTPGTPVSTPGSPPDGGDGGRLRLTLHGGVDHPELVRTKDRRKQWQNFIFFWAEGVRLLPSFQKRLTFVFIHDFFAQQISNLFVLSSILNNMD